MIKVIEGIGKRIEVEADQVRIARTDVLATLLNTIVAGDEVVRFSDIASIRCHTPESLRFTDQATGCTQLVLQRHDHTQVSLSFRQAQAAEVQALRTELETQVAALAER